MLFRAIKENENVDVAEIISEVITQVRIQYIDNCFTVTVTVRRVTVIKARFHSGR